MKFLCKNILVLSIASLFMFSCTPSGKDPDKDYGNVQMSTTYSHTGNATYFYYLQGSAKVEIRTTDGTIIHTLYIANGNGSADFGDIEYGNYIARMSATEIREKYADGSTIIYQNYSSTQDLIVNSPSTNIAFTIH